MLASIHPFGERSKDNRYWVTSAAYTVASTAGGSALGAVGGVIATLVMQGSDLSTNTRTVALIAALVAAFMVDIAGLEGRLPQLRRQVDENWLTTYRGWVYGAGFGAQLGFGFLTFVTTGYLYAMVVAMVLSQSFAIALSIGAFFGLARGLVLLSTRSVRSPETLRGFHRRLETLRGKARIGSHMFMGSAMLIASSFLLV